MTASILQLPRPSGDEGVRFKTVSEQRLEYLESLHRPLTDAESDELRKAMHAVYCRRRRRVVSA